MKKILLFLAVIMACTLSAASASVVASGTHDTNLTWKLDDAGVLTISGDGEMTDFIDFGSYDWRAANIKEATKTVVIEDGVTGIGAYAFMNFPALTRVSMADSVTRIGDKAFYECGSLSDVYLSENLETIGSSAFFNCNAISEADLPEQLVSIGDSAFYSCDQLATAHLPERLVSIGEKAFDSCDKLSPVLIPSAVTSIGNFAFDGCHSLEEITIPATVISMGKYVFSNCTSLKTAVVEEGVIALPEGTLNNCYMLESVTLPSTLTSIGGWAFNTGSYGTTYPMTSVSIPDSVVAIGEYAFNCQTGLSEIHLPAGLQSIGQKAFSRCLALTEVTIPDGTESIGAEAFLGDTALLKMTIPRSVIEIGANAFLDCDQLSLYCYESSEAHTYAGEQSIPFVLLEEANTNPPPAPTNICWKEGSTATAAWDPVSGASYYRITVRVFCEGQEIGNTMTGTAEAEIDVQAEINQIMQSEGVTQAVQVAFSVSAARESEQGTYEYGDESSPSEFLLYELGATYLSTPEDVAVNTEGIASWKAVENANYYYVLLEMKRTSDEESEQFVTGTYNQPDENGIVTFDMTQSINFLGYGSQSEDIALMRIQVSASPADQTLYMSSPYSEFTAFVEYHPLPTVESFILSPSSPILYVGHSLYLGRTIIPEDAYYTSISYASSDDEVVSVGDDGQIRGVNTGSAEITAIIGTITASVPVTVYAISSNIEDSETNIEVTDTAGSIIDLIGNNEEPDLSNTDISADLTDDLRDQILEGIERGDEFHADWWWKWYGWEHYRSWWEYILALLNDGRYATGYDAGFEMYHQNGQEKHHIGNITEFEKEIDFVFDMPENLPATDAGHHREYTLIRIHDGQIEEIPVEFDSHGKFRGKSDRFSDFVLMYQDKEDLTTVASGRCGEKVSWALDQDGVLTVSGSGATEACSPTEEPWHAFKEQIKEVIISEGVTALEAGFSACPALTRVALPSTIQQMSPGVFKNCQRLNDIVIPDGISTKEIPYYQDGCLRVVSVPANCECTGSVFEGCTIGREIVPDFVLPEDLTAVETEAFEGTSMIYLRIPGSVEKIGSRAFADCSCLKYVYIDAHHGNDLEIAENAFEGCNGLMFIGYINEALEHMIEENDYGIVENPV